MKKSKGKVSIFIIFLIVSIWFISCDGANNASTESIILNKENAALKK